jgi:hypothetical protein
MKKSAEVFGASIESVSSRLESLEKTVQLLTQSSNFQYLSQTSDFQVGPHRVKWDQADGEEKATKNLSRLNFLNQFLFLGGGFKKVQRSQNILHMVLFFFWFFSIHLC